MYQKKLEEQTKCKILIRGKGHHRDALPVSDNQYKEGSQHVLIIGTTERSVKHAKEVVEQMLLADESKRNEIRSEQLADAQNLA